MEVRWVHRSDPSFSLGIGAMPGRKQLALYTYSESENVYTILAWVKSEAAAEIVTQFFGRLGGLAP